MRLSDDQVDALDQLADAEHGGSRSKALRYLIDHADADDPPDRMTSDALRDALEAQAQGGSVQAIRQLQDTIANERRDEQLDRLNALTRG